MNNQNKQNKIINDSDFIVKKKPRRVSGEKSERDSSINSLNEIYAIKLDDVEKSSGKFEQMLDESDKQNDKSKEEPAVQDTLDMVPLPRETAYSVATSKSFRFKDAKNTLLNDLVPMEEDVKSSKYTRLCIN